MRERRIAVIAALGLAALAVAVKAGVLRDADAAVMAWVQVGRIDALDAAARWVTFFGSAPWMIGATAIMVVWWLRQGDRVSPKVFLGAWALGLAVQWGLRFWVAQWRPDTVMPPGPGEFWARYDLAGFTSGHVFRSTLFFGWGCLIMARRKATWLAVGAGAMLVAVGLTRVYLERHWPTDVLGGWLLATTMLAIARSWQARTAS